MRFIYLDEAGTSAPEAFTVVVGIIVKPDLHWKRANSAVQRIMSTVPSNVMDRAFLKHRKSPIFHAKDVWNNERYRHDWSKDDRKEFISQMISVPVREGMSICVGVASRNPDIKPLAEKMGMRLEDFNHFEAMVMCLRRAGLFMRERCSEDEIAAAIYEDVPEKRSMLAKALAVAQKAYTPIGDHHFRTTKQEIASGKIFQREAFGVDEIKDGLSFATKNDAPLLQLADACAFGIRRFLCNQEYGRDWILAMGADWDIDDWLGGHSGALLSNDPRLRLAPLSIGVGGGRLGLS